MKNGFDKVALHGPWYWGLQVYTNTLLNALYFSSQGITDVKVEYSKARVQCFQLQPELSLFITDWWGTSWVATGFNHCFSKSKWINQLFRMWHFCCFQVILSGHEKGFFFSPLLLAIVLQIRCVNVQILIRQILLRCVSAKPAEIT